MNEDKPSSGMSYAEAGVDIVKAAELVNQIKTMATATVIPGVLSGVGGFGSAFELPRGYRQPVLVSGTDGVGTKCLLANRLGQYDTIGIDLVAMCVNDILCLGAKPLYFLDYYATGKLDLVQSAAIVKGIAGGCLQAKMALIGGETAELPGMYAGNDYDLAGFCVGVVEKDQMLTAGRVQAGDGLIAVASSGPHANGYSLIRRVLGDCDLEDLVAEGNTLGEVLLKPTTIYVNSMLALLQALGQQVHALAHVTGGGIDENLPRVMPTGLEAVIDTKTWTWPPIFSWLQQRGAIELTEMRRTFNLGVGMVVVVAERQIEAALQLLQQAGEPAWVVGVVRDSTSAEPLVVWD